MIANEVDAAEYERLRKESPLEALLMEQIRALGLPEPEREVRLISGRKFRTDFVFRGEGIAQPLAVEVDGGTWINGGHSTGSGFEKDSIKICEYALLGFRFMRFTGDMVRSGVAVDYIQKALEMSELLSTHKRTPA
jgi:hypothetical protein